MQTYNNPSLAAQREEFLENLRRQNPNNPVETSGTLVSLSYELPRTPEVDSALVHLRGQ